MCLLYHIFWNLNTIFSTTSGVFFLVFCISFIASHISEVIGSAVVDRALPSTDLMTKEW